MATQSDSIPGSGYGNVYIDSLALGCGWDTSTGPIKYAFGSGDVAAADSSIGAFTGQAWQASEKQAFVNALGQYAAVCDLTFAQASDPADADIVWWLTDTAHIGYGVLGMHEVPDQSWAPIYGYFNTDYMTAAYGGMAVGSYSYITAIHELGHGLGLAHPHDGGSEPDATIFPGVRGPWSTGKSGLNQGIWTTMSYNDGWNLHPSPSDTYGWQGSPMALDIAALQALYGANMGSANGDNVYELPHAAGAGSFWQCIWDAGGVDTMSNAGSSLAATINLNSAPLTGANAGGYVSWDQGIAGGYTIANGVLIENAIGGLANDVLIGNTAANVLDGRAGADQMNGGPGDDTYYVDNARDKVTELSAGGTDNVLSTVSLTLTTNVENLTLLDSGGAINAAGNNLNNVLTGNASANVLNGGSGNDSLIGAGGFDTLTGGRGADTFVFQVLGDTGVGVGLRDVITDFNAGQGDRIDLAALDAIAATPAADDAFTYIGAAAFSVGVAGQLRFEAGILAGEVTGDGIADFEIQLVGARGFDALSLLV